MTQRGAERDSRDGAAVSSPEHHLDLLQLKVRKGRLGGPCFRPCGCRRGLFRLLRRRNPQPCHAYARSCRHQLLGASPKGASQDHHFPCRTNTRDTWAGCLRARPTLSLCDTLPLSGIGVSRMLQRLARAAWSLAKGAPVKGTRGPPFLSRLLKAAPAIQRRPVRLESQTRLGPPPGADKKEHCSGELGTQPDQSQGYIAQPRQRSATGGQLVPHLSSSARHLRAKGRLLAAPRDADDIEAGPSDRNSGVRSQLSRHGITSTVTRTHCPSPAG